MSSISGASSWSSAVRSSCPSEFRNAPGVVAAPVALTCDQVTDYARRYRRIARSLSSAELRGVSMDSMLTQGDLALWRGREPRFLDYYGDDGLRLALDRYGFVAEANKRGYGDIEIETHCDDERHTLIVTGIPEGGGPPERLADAVVRRDTLLPQPLAGLPPLEVSYEVLTVDWLSLRNPLERFTPERPRLPGQDAPGLGIARQVFELLCRAVERLHLEALLSTPEYFHNAVLYMTRMPFLDPRCAGQVQALMQALLLREHLSLAQASWAVDWGLVRGEGADDPFTWRGEAQIWPRSADLAAYVQSDAYFRQVGEAAAGLRFELDRGAFEERWQREKDAFEGRAAAVPAGPVSDAP